MRRFPMHAVDSVLLQSCLDASLSRVRESEEKEDDRDQKVAGRAETFLGERVVPLCLALVPEKMREPI